MRRHRRGLALLAGVVALAGCGGGDSLYGADPTRRCLERSGAQVSSEDAEYLYGAVSRGFEVVVGANRLSMAFDATSSAAEVTEKAFERYFPEGDKLQRRGNVVLAWDKIPSGPERSRVEDCLAKSEGAESVRGVVPA
jgi:hypothetical protein